MRPNVALALGAACLASRTLAAPTTAKATILADSNRDGKVDIAGDANVKCKNTWTEDAGAIFLPNIGDTDRRCSKKLLEGPAKSNAELDDCNDASDDVQRAPQFMAPLKTVPMKGLSDKATGRVVIEDPVARKNVRIFRKQGRGGWKFTGNKYAFSAAELRKGLDLGIDGRDTRRPDGWDGRVTVKFIVKDGEKTTTDSVVLRVAPVLTHHHLQDVMQVISTAGNKSELELQLKFTKDLGAAVKDSGLTTPPLWLFSHSDDIWAQDFIEPGYASMPGPEGPVTLRIVIRSPQDSRVAGRQAFEYYRTTGIGAVQHLGGKRDEINSGGNIECIPPHTAPDGKVWPAGRVILGNHGEQKHHILSYLRAQETQEPVLLDTDWLAIGHVDEFLQFIPTDTERGWSLVADDPLLGIQLLEDLQKNGHGSTLAYSRKNDTAPPNGGGDDSGLFNDPIPVPSTTIDQVLANTQRLADNRKCAARITANLEILKRETGITDADIVRIPALFDNGGFGGGNATTLKVTAFYPGVVNNLVMSGFRTSIAPNPWGPVVDGKDVLAAEHERAYKGLNWTLSWVDDWNTHHNYGGEVHCGSNSARTMGEPWW